MHLSQHSLHQLDKAYLDVLDEAGLWVLSVKLLEDLKEARDRLNQGPDNSSRPPSSRAPWERQSGERESDEDPENAALDPPPAAEPAAVQPVVAKLACKAGKQPWAPGIGQTQV